jgi:hypothetical protein
VVDETWLKTVVRTLAAVGPYAEETSSVKCDSAGWKTPATWPLRTVCRAAARMEYAVKTIGALCCARPEAKNFSWLWLPTKGSVGVRVARRHGRR